MKEELSKLREAHFEEIHSLEVKLKKAEDKCSIKAKEWEAREKTFQDKITTLEGKGKEQEDSHAAEVAELKGAALAAKVKEAENLEGEAI